MADFADYYREIYVRGLGGETPSIPVAVEEQERRAHEAMDPRAANYVFAGAGAEHTMRANRDAFERYRIVPRMLRDVAQRDLSTTRARHGDAGAADAGADRRAEGRPRGRRAGDRARRRRGRRADDRQHRLALHARGDRRGRRRGAALVPALLAQRPRAGRELRRAAPSAPATARSCSPSTPSSPAGSRATCSRPGCPSSTAWASPTTSRTRSSAPAWRRRPRRTRAPPPATSSASRPTPR